MTSADTPYPRASAVARGWRTFRRWRRGRPFWGGLITILSGTIFFLSGHVTFGGIKITFGPEEFLGWVIPLLLVLCGLLMWVTPAQRIFYGVLAAAISVGGLLGLNLGGFIVGMLLGMVGGALGASWAPVQLPPPVADTPPAADTPPSADAPLPAEDEEYAPVEEPEEQQQYPRSGLLGDTLPTSTTSPLGVPPVEAPGSAGALPRRSPRGLVVILLVVTTAGGLGLGMVRTASPAEAAQTCGAPAAAATRSGTTRAPSTAAAPAATTPAAPASPAARSSTPGAAPTSSPTGGTSLGQAIGNLVTDVVDGIGKLFGTGDQTDPSATPSAAPATPTAASPAAPASPAPRAIADPTAAPRSPTAAPKRTPTRAPSPSPTCATAKALAAPADSTEAAADPATQITAVLEQVNLSFDGVTSLPTANGSIRVLQFSMDSSASTPFELRVPVNDRTLDYRSSKLTVSGHVRFYTSELDIAGYPVFTPDSDLTKLLEVLPPGFTLPYLPLPAVTLKLVLVRADTLTAPDLTIAYL